MILRELIHKIAFSSDMTGFNKATSKFDELIKKSRKTGIAMTAAFTLPLSLMGKSVIKTISDFEQLDVAFETMLGSADKAQKLITEMTDFAAETPFEIKGLFDNVKQLLAVGFQADELKGHLTALGNIASALGREKMPLIVKAFGDVRAKTKLTGEELRQFQGMGVPLTEVLAKMLGKTTAEITKMVPASKISFDLVAKALKSVSKEGGRFFELMKKQSKTLGGQWSNLQDNITKTFLKAKDTWLPVLKKVVAAMNKVVKLIGDNLTPSIVRLTTVLGVLLATAGPLLIFFSIVSLPMLKAVAIIGGLILILALLVEDIWAYAEGQESVVGMFLKPWDQLKHDIKEKLSHVKKTFSFFWQDLKDDHKALNKWFWEHGGKQAAAIESWFHELELKELFSDLYEKLKNITREFWDWMSNFFKNAINGLWDWISEKLNWILKKTVGLLNKIPGVNIGGGDEEITAGAASEINNMGAIAAGAIAGANIEPLMNSYGAGNLRTVNQNTNQLNANFEIKTYVPEGTPESQVQYIQQQSEEINRKMVNDVFQELNNNIPTFE